MTGGGGTTCQVAIISNEVARGVLGATVWMTDTCRMDSPICKSKSNVAVTTWGSLLRVAISLEGGGGLVDAMNY